MPAKPSIRIRQTKPTRDKSDWQPRKIMVSTVGGIVSLPAVSMHAAALTDKFRRQRRGFQS